MQFWSVFLVVYAMTAFFALCMTHLEQSRQSRSRLGWTLVGYALCLVWPLIACVTLILAAFQPAPLRPVKAD